MRRLIESFVSAAGVGTGSPMHDSACQETCRGESGLDEGTMVKGVKCNSKGVVISVNISDSTVAVTSDPL